MRASVLVSQLAVTNEYSASLIPNTDDCIERDLLPPLASSHSGPRTCAQGSGESAMHAIQAAGNTTSQRSYTCAYGGDPAHRELIVGRILKRPLHLDRQASRDSGGCFGTRSAAGPSGPNEV